MNESQLGGTERGTERIEAFSDGVFAIAITLLVLEIKIPHLQVVQQSARSLASLFRLCSQLRDDRHLLGEPSLHFQAVPED